MPRTAARTQAILATLAELYPGATTELNWETPFQLLIATILSAQSTDKRVNQVTARLFPRYPDAFAFAALEPEALAEAIKDVGLYRSKARNIVATCRILVSQLGGQVPADRATLEALPGVGRKTANVVLSNAFGEPAIAVDTHVFRVANRLGLARAKTPEKTEQQLMRRIPQALWSQAHHWLIFHGRRVCSARNPKCQACALAPYCPTGRRRQRAAVTKTDSSA